MTVVYYLFVGILISLKMKRLNSKKQKSLRGSKADKSGGGRMKGELSCWCLDDALVLPYSFFIVRGRYTYDCFSHHFWRVVQFFCVYEFTTAAESMRHDWSHSI